MSLRERVDVAGRLQLDRTLPSRAKLLLVEGRPLGANPIARGGNLPERTARLSIAIRASCSPYSAWKCGGTWSAKNILMTMP
jgi:hypothetical protein